MEILDPVRSTSDILPYLDPDPVHPYAGSTLW